MSNSVQPHRWQPTRLLHPWDSPGKNTGVGCHFLLQCMKVKSESEVAQWCPTPSDPMDCSLPGSSVHGIFQARVLEWGADFATNSVIPITPFSGSVIHWVDSQNSGKNIAYIYRCVKKYATQKELNVRDAWVGVGSFHALPCPSMPFLALPCPSMPFLALPCPSMPSAGAPPSWLLVFPRPEAH